MGNRYVLMKRLMIGALLWAGFANAQGTPGYHQLRAEEFEGMPEFNRADVVAYTHCYIDFNYHAKSERGVYRLTAEVKLQFNRDKSWINKRKVFSTKMLDDILDHEQGHYTIAYMEQQEWISAAPVLMPIIRPKPKVYLIGCTKNTASFLWTTTKILPT